jgi:signal peptidase I
MDQKIKSRFKSILNWVSIIFVSLSIAIVLRVFFFEIYMIPSSSMEPALLPGDIIIVSKMSYGARVLKPVKFLKAKKIEYIRTNGWSSLKKGDIFVFNWPKYKTFADSGSSIYGACVVKRCYGMPGDNVLIKNEGIKNEGSVNFHKDLNLFPFDSTLGWSVDNYGPLYVPAKGEPIELTKRIVSWYKDILRFENPGDHIEDSCLITNDGKRILQYSFKHDYYFVLGDNFYGSEDSRFWGFVPDGNVIGKTGFVLFSLDPFVDGFKKIRWSRIMKII